MNLCDDNKKALFVKELKELLNEKKLNKELNLSDFDIECMIYDNLKYKENGNIYCCYIAIVR